MADPSRRSLDAWVTWAAGAPSLTEWQLHSGHGVAGTRAIARLVRLAELARSAEREGRRQRADHYWDEAHRAARAGAQRSTDWPDAIRGALLETHWAFVRGALRGRPEEAVRSDDRAFAHADRIERLFALLPDEAAAHRSDLEAVRRIRADALERESRLDEAVAALLGLARLAPDAAEYVERAAAIRMQLASRALEGPGDDAAKEKALAAAVAWFAELRKGFPPQLGAVQLEAIARNAHAVRLANVNRISEALVECRRALELDPQLEGAEKAYESLVELMREVQQRIPELAAQLRSGQSLNAAGSALLRESRIGFGPVEAFATSDERAALAGGRRDALARHVWAAAGLGAPGNAPDARFALLDAMNDVAEQPPASAAGLEEAWARAVESRPALAGVDPAGPRAHLHRVLFPDDAAPPRPPPRAPPVLGDGPVLEAGAARAKGDGVPFRAWLYAPCDLRVKAQCAVALVFVALATGLVVRERSNLMERAAAWTAAHAAAEAGDSAAALDACTRFGAAHVRAEDERLQEMGRLCDDALVTWLLEEEPGDAEVDARVAARASWQQDGRTP